MPTNSASSFPTAEYTMSKLPHDDNIQTFIWASLIYQATGFLSENSTEEFLENLPQEQITEAQLNALVASLFTPFFYYQTHTLTALQYVTQALRTESDIQQFIHIAFEDSDISDSEFDYSSDDGNISDSDFDYSSDDSDISDSDFGLLSDDSDDGLSAHTLITNYYALNERSMFASASSEGESSPSTLKRPNSCLRR